MAQGLSSLLGGLAQGFTDLGKSTLDVLGGGTTNNVITAGLDALINKKSYGQAVKDANQRQKDFRKWLYETDSDKDAAAKGLGTALNGAQTAIDLIPGLGQSAPVNAIQGAIGGLADEFKFNGENYDWGKGAQRAAVGAGAGLAAGGLGKALANSGSKVLSNGVLKGAATGSLGGALSQAGGTAIEGGNADQILQSAAQGAQFGALLGAGTGSVQSLAGALKKTRAKNGAPTDNADINELYDYPMRNGGFSADVKRIGSADVAPVNENTLPGGWKELENYLDTAKDRVPNAIGKSRSRITKQDLAKYLDEVGYDSEGTKDQLWRTVQEAIDDETVDNLYNEGGTAGQFLQERLPGRGNRGLTDATNYYIGNKGRTGRLDAEYSDRLGIGRSNTPMSDRLVNPYGAAGGDYSEGAFGTNPTWATGEQGVSTAAHERLHAMQDINPYDWDEEVVNAIDDLRQELGKHYHNENQIKKYWGNNKTDYYAKDIEQEARMLQSYLDNEGYTKTGKVGSERGTEWGNEIKPAFDKFFDKLRELSKKGVALPAILAALGLGEYATENQEEDKDNGQQI